MLVLSRKAGEKIVVDGNITVEVIRMKGNRVTLGITAPESVKILRGELNNRPTPAKIVEIVVEDGMLTAI
ncbi:MAG: carbon storage regulator [Planctomycetales bacterium]|nr:carbon storage regulator [Planctomycetales bacterium]